MGIHNTVLAMSACLMAANAHMLMNTPKLFDSPIITNGPIEADGSNFPCKITPGQSFTAGSAAAANVFPQGSKQPLKFIGSAVHGGGSCQVSLSTDVNPTAQSKWKVIHSIVGGCPAQGQSGILPANDPNAPDPYEYSFTIPSNIPPGNFSLALSWLNKIGNREFYMNCAPVVITGSGGDIKNLDALPDMFVANIPVPGSCGEVPENYDVDFPEPGPSVETLAGSTTSAIKKPTCTGVASGSSGSGAGGGASSSTAAAATPSAANPGGSGGGFQTNASPSTAVAVKTSSSIVSSAQSVASNNPSSGSGSGSASSTPEGSSCTDPGEVNCLGTSYLICASGKWVSMPLAAGTKCTPGAGLNIVATNLRREVQFKA